MFGFKKNKKDILQDKIDIMEHLLTHSDFSRMLDLKTQINETASKVDDALREIDRLKALIMIHLKINPDYRERP
jgi:hypothetical protein